MLLSHWMIIYYSLNLQTKISL